MGKTNHKSKRKSKGKIKSKRNRTIKGTIKSKQNRRLGGGKDDKAKTNKNKNKNDYHPYHRSTPLLFISKGDSIILKQKNDKWREDVRWWKSDEDLKKYLDYVFGVYKQLNDSFNPYEAESIVEIDKIKRGLSIGEYFNWDNEHDAKELRKTFYFHLVSYIPCHYTELVEKYTKEFIQIFIFFLEGEAITGIFKLIPGVDTRLEECLKNYPKVYDKITEKWSHGATISNTLITNLTSNPRCIYGNKCTRMHNPDHVGNFSHPK